MTPKLKPCPFCGKKAKVLTWSLFGMKNTKEYYSVSCPGCDINTDNSFTTELKAIKRWNTRAK